MKKIFSIIIFACLAFVASAQMPGVDIRPASTGGSGAMHYKSNDNMVSNFTPTLAAYPLELYATCQDLRRGNEAQWNGISWVYEDIDNGEQATVAYTTTNPASNIATGWDSWRYNRMTVNYTTSGVDTFYIDMPLYFDTTGQLPGEIFVIDFNTSSRTGDADTVLIHFDSLFRTYDGQLLDEWKCPPRGRIWMAFRAHVSVEGFSWVEVDDILGSYGHGSSSDISPILRETGTDTLIPYPDSFAYRPFDIFRNGANYNVGQFSPENRSGIAVSKTYYVDVNTGNDSDDGLSWANAFKSLNVALAKTDADSVAVAKGVYWWRNAWQNQAPANDMKIVADLTQGVGDSVWITRLINDKLTTGWTNVGSYYFALYNRVPDTVNVVYDAANLNTYGDPLPLTSVASVALVNSTANSYRVSNDTIYIHLFDGRAPDSSVELVGKNYGNSSNGIIGANRTVYLENINFKYSSLYCQSATNSRIYIDGMRAVSTSFFFDDVEEVMVFNFVGGTTGDDILNYDPGTIIPNVVEYNVNAHLTQTVGCTNCQASTVHNGISVIRINGQYKATNGQNIADVNGSKSLLYNCSASGAVPSSSAGFYFGGGSGNYAMLERCTSTQTSGRFDIQTAGTGTLEVRYFTGSQTNDLAVGMPLTNYTPDETFGGKVSEMARTVVLGENDLLYVAKIDSSGNYLSTAILASDLFDESGAILKPGNIEGALSTPQLFRKGVWVNGSTGASIAAKSLSITSPAFKFQAAIGHTGNIGEIYDGDGTLVGRMLTGGRLRLGTDAGTVTSTYSWLYGSGNPIFDLGGKTVGQMITFKWWGGSQAWSWKYQGNFNSGALDLDWNNDNLGSYDFRFKTGGTYDVAVGYQVAGLATSGNYLRGNGTNFVSSAIQAADIPDLGSTYFKQNGNSFGATAVFGTNDNNPVAIETNGIERIVYNTDGTSLQESRTAGTSTTIHTYYYGVSSPADDDEMLVKYDLENSTGAQETYAQVKTIATNVTNGSEEGSYILGAMNAGTVTDMLEVYGQGVRNYGAAISKLRTNTASGTSAIASNDYYVRIDATTGAQTLTLPTAFSGRTLVFKRIDNNAATVITFTGTVDGSVNPTSTGGGSPIAVLANQYASITLVANGSTWDVVD